MWIAVAPAWDGGVLLPLDVRDAPVGPELHMDEWAAEVRGRERAAAVRRIWTETAAVYPGLLRAGVPVSRVTT